MSFKGDYHMHSRYSDGRATVAEMVAAGGRMGLPEIAITDHGPCNIGTGVRQHTTFISIKEEVRRVAEEHPNMKVMTGAEANITGLDGTIDVPADIYRELDLLLVGLHPYVWPDTLGDGLQLVVGNQLQRVSSGLRRRVINNNTKALVEALHRHPVDIVTHPGLQMPLDVTELARACVKTDTMYEVNTGHHYQNPAQLRLAAKEGVTFVINSDAHFPETVGDLEPGLHLLIQAGVPHGQIANLIQPV